MKKKLYYMFLCLLTSFICMNTVFADELDFSVSASISGESTVVKGEETTILVSLKSADTIANCTFQVNSDNNVELVSKLGMNSWDVKDDTNGIKVTNNTLESGLLDNGKNILSLKYRVNDNSKITIKTIECATVDNEKTGTYSDVSVDLKVKDISEDTTLSKLVVTGGTLSPSFNSSVKQYFIQLDSTNFSLDLTASNADYQDDIAVTDENGKTLNPSSITFNNSNNQGQMLIVVTVNKDTVYNLLAVYEEEELDNSLKSLKVYDQTIELEKDKYDYTVTIGDSVSSVKIEAVLKDTTNFKFTEEFGGVQIVQTPSNSTSFPIIIEPNGSQVGAEGVTYIITMVKKGSNETGGGTGGSSNNKENTSTNPSTGGISMVVMMIILMASLIGSIVIYQKNLEGYNK